MTVHTKISVTDREEDPARRRRITKVKYDGKKVEIQYEVDRKSGGDPDSYKLMCGDEPRPAFVDVFAAMADQVADWLEMDGAAAAWADDVAVTGVILSHANDVRGATLTVRKTLAMCQSPLILNLPHKPEEPYSEGDPEAENDCLTGEVIRLLDKLEQEANAYIDGSRAQMSIGEAAEGADHPEAAVQAA
jgi:hypothetical protein